MARLYWKIFLGYWAIAVVTVVATSMALALLSDRDEPRRFRQLTENRLEAAALTAEELLVRGGEPALMQWLTRQTRRFGNVIWVLREDGRDVIGRPLPPPLRAALRGNGDRHGPPLPTRRITGPDGTDYVLLMPPLDFRALAPARRPFRLAGLVIAIAISGLVCWVLARYLTRPISELQAASRRLASGERGVRVGPVIGRRSDEIGALGAEFDNMAEQLEQAMAAQRRLLQDVSHELRSPLARLRVALGLARLRGDGVTAELDRIELEADRLDQMIGQLMAMMRLQAGVDADMSAPVDIGRLVVSVAEDADFEAGSEGRGVRCAAMPAAHVRGDAALLRSVFENVIRNAVRHTPEDTVVEIAMAAAGPREVDIVVTIRDHGPGVPAEALPRLFDPFFRVEEARDRESGGHGLGLAIARQAVRRHKGEIWAQNAPGGGLIVSVQLPRA